jgi:multisubunit Na+/H+ antiporter MnhE subunit
VRTAWIFALGAALGGGLYLLLIDTTSLPELYVLAGVALLCALGMLLAREQGFVEARVALAWLAGARRLAWQVPLDIATLCAVALAQLVQRRPARGAFRTTRFDATAETPQDTGRRALAEWIGSLSPNTIVVGVDDERGLLLVHQLHVRGEPEQLDLLRLG